MNITIIVMNIQKKKKNIKLSKIYKYSTKIKINVLKLSVKKKVIHNRLTILATP